jgi:DNA-binding XRE family transcriptional regulator
MEPFQYPPLSPLILEEIRQSIYKIDQRYWPLIIEFRVPRFTPPSVPVPPRRPLQLIELFRSYALELFKAEADRFEPFRADRLYVPWLSSLSNRIGVHIQDVFRQLEEGDPDSLLTFHGASNLRIGAAVNETLSEIARQYRDGEAKPTQIESSRALASATEEALATQIKRLQVECDLTAEEMAEALKIEPRSVYKHLAGQTVPRRKHLAAYEKLFSERLEKSVTFRKVSKRSPKGQ